MCEELSKTEIKKISKKLGWSLSETGNAIKEFKESESIVNRDALLRICLNTENPIKRRSKIAELLCFSNHTTEENVIKLLEYDKLIFVLRVFNIYDILFDQNIDAHFRYEIGKKIKTILIENEEVAKGSFLNFNKHFTVQVKHSDIFDGYADPNDLFKQHIKLDDIANTLCDTYLTVQLSYNIYNSIKLTKTKHKTETMNKQQFNDFVLKEGPKILTNAATEGENFVLNLFSLMEFRIIKIPLIQESLWSNYELKYLPGSRDFITKLKNSLMNIKSNKNEITDKQYWFYYCLIEKIKEKGYKTKPASEIAEKLLNLAQSGSIRNIYYIKNKQAKEIENFDINKFIIEQGFKNPINEYLDKVEFSQ